MYSSCTISVPTSQSAATSYMMKHLWLSQQWRESNCSDPHSSSLSDSNGPKKLSSTRLSTTKEEQHTVKRDEDEVAS